jgi:hypothetical protein
MSEEIKIETLKTRRSAIKTAAQVAVTAPAVGLLLSASTKAASARIHYGDDSAVTVTQNPGTARDDGFDDGFNAGTTTITGPTGDDFFTF